jgi:beta-lactamase superfamily II metal-dependent hydrolase
MRLALCAALLVLVPALAFAQANGKLQIHHMKVGQGDGMLLISPLGETALFDDGVYTNCTYIKSYLQGLGISVVDYHFASHYHADHIGCIDDLAAINITIGTAGYDRGSSYSSATFTAYVNTLGAKRTTMAKNQVVTLDAGAANPVSIRCVDLNGAGVYSPSGSDENAKSLVVKVSYGAFDEVIGGDLTGSVSQGNDVESTVGPEVGDVEVYKVHHHGSSFSSNDNWLDATTPEVGIIQVGNGNPYGHPTAAALGRLHAHGVKTYWTETGAGATPDPTWDKVASETVVVQADPGTSDSYTVSGPGFSDTYPNGGGPPPPPILTETLVATSMTMIKGSITVGDVTRLAADDAVRVSISAGVDGGKYLTDWYGSVTLNHPPTQLTITYDGNYTISRTQTLYLWNWGTAAWVQVDQASVSTSDVTRSWTTTSPASYVSATKEVRLRVASNKRNNSFTCRGDYMAFTYDYVQGTAPALASRPREEGEPADQVDREFPELPLSVLTRLSAAPSSEGITLTWAVDLGAHVDGFNIYREDAAGGRLFAGNEAMVGLAGDQAEFRFVDPATLAIEATYWLGARACSGAEAMIGPIRVAAFASGAPVAFAASPSLVREGTRFDFSLPERAEVQLDVFDVTGRRVASVFRGTLEAGPASFEWRRTTDAGEIAAPGVYFARLQGFGRTQLTRMTVLAK